MKMFGYVYLTTNLINGKMYIGQKQGRFCSWYTGSGRLIRRAVKKYGKENFSVRKLQEASSERSLDALEIKVLESYRRRFGSARLYNLSLGGESGSRGYHHTAAHKKRISEKLKGVNTWSRGRILTEEHRQRISDGLRGRPAPFKGKHLPEQWRKNISASLKGRIFSDAHRKNLKKFHVGNRGYVPSLENRKNMSRSQKIRRQREQAERQARA